jgi:hypothetical protein
MTKHTPRNHSCQSRPPSSGVAPRAVVAALTASALIAWAPALAAQVSGDPCDRVAPAMAPLHLDPTRQAELRRAMEASPVGYVRGSSRRLLCRDGDGPGFRLEMLPLDAMGQHNSAYPRAMLNGLRWAGRGLSTEVGGGVAASWGPLSAALAPRLAHHENRPFKILPVTHPGTSSYAWYWRPTNIDWPQRFGAGTVSWIHPGESYVRLDAYGAALGFSTETLRWGPARRNPLLMSGGAPGFPHVFLGSARPVGVWIGDLSVELSWGHLAESDFFDDDPANDTRLLAGLVAALELRWVPGLTLGFSRAYSRTLPPGGWPILDYITEPFAAPLSNKFGDEFAADNDMASVFARWIFPAVELEIYGEFARDDLWEDWTHLLMAPEHSGALTFGLQKLLPVGSDPDDERRVRVAAEVTSLNISNTQRGGTGDVLFYTHSRVAQGHTHRGQLLGAPIGPGSDAQSLELDFLAGRWIAGLHLERVRYNNDVYYNVYGLRYAHYGHDVELTGGLRGGLLLPGLGLEVFGDVALSGRYNRDFIVLHSPFFELGYERNLSVQLGASWRPAFGRIGAASGPVSPPARP